MTILASVNNKTVMPGITPIADVPDTPTIGTATATNLTASVTFTAATTGGTPTTFTATSNPGSITGTSSTSPITVSGLTDGTSYTFTVRANNSTGSSANSAASNSITPVEPLTGGYDSLATVIVPSGGLSTISFAGIPAGYKHLQIRCAVLTTSGGINIQYNGDTGSNYTYHQLYGTGTSALANAGTSQTAGFIGYNNAAGSNPTIIVCDILDYQNTNKYTTHKSLAGTDVNASGGALTFFSGLWLNTAEIRTIDIKGTFSQHSHFALYGVK